MAEEKIRLGGMALPNGVLVHGPHSWACAIRHEDGRIEVASARKRLQASRIQSPLLRGPARLAEALRAAAADQGEASRGAAADGEPAHVSARCSAPRSFVRGLRESGLRPVARELLSSVVSIAPAVMALRSGELAAYHGAEHISIGTYEHGKRATREHERCGGHLVGPLLVTSAVGQRARGARAGAPSAAGPGGGADRRDRRGDRALRLDDAGIPRIRSRAALAKPGHELQHRFSTAEPSAEQLEVAEAALEACLELEQAL